MSVKMIASDFDGTIGSGERLAKDIEAINEFRAAGNLFGLVSGRNVHGLRWVKEKFGVPVDFLLSDSGGTCYIDGKMIFCEQASAAVFDVLTAHLMARKSILVAANRFDGSDMLYYRHSDGREEYNPKRSEWQARAFPQMSGLFPTHEECMRQAEEVERLFPNLTALPNDDCLDIVPKGRNKAVGIAQLAGYFGVALNDVYTIGDNYNDIAMLDAYKSFVVKNGPEEVQKHATVAVVGSVHEMIGMVM